MFDLSQSPDPEENATYADSCMFVHVFNTDAADMIDLLKNWKIYLFIYLTYSYIGALTFDHEQIPDALHFVFITKC